MLIVRPRDRSMNALERRQLLVRAQRSTPAAVRYRLGVLHGRQRTPA
jgi:hypothetical protein